MDDDQLREGRDLLLLCLAAPKAIASTDTTEARAQRDAVQRDAVATLDEWDEPNFARFEATLQRHHPSACEYVFHELSASMGVAAVTGVATFLTRIAALEDGFLESESFRPAECTFRGAPEGLVCRPARLRGRGGSFTAAANNCLPVEARLRILGVPEEAAKADEEAFLRRVEAARAASR